MLGCTILMALCTVGALATAIVALNKKQEVSIEQPLVVKFAAEFVHKNEFEQVKLKNEHEHENLFKKIGGVERGSIERLDKYMGELQDRAEEGREKIHRRLNRMSIGLANLCGRVGAKMPSEEEEL